MTPRIGHDAEVPEGYRRFTEEECKLPMTDDDGWWQNGVWNYLADWPSFVGSMSSPKYVHIRKLTEVESLRTQLAQEKEAHRLTKIECEKAKAERNTAAMWKARAEIAEGELRKMGGGK